LQHYFYIEIYLPDQTTQDNKRKNKIHKGEEQNTRRRRTRYIKGRTKAEQ
jgi:hypothetical protein